VGAYFNVDTAKYVTSETYKLMMNENLMRSFHIYTWQGDYNKILFSAKSVSSGADTIVNYLTARQGLTMNLYNNSVLSVIGDNELMIKQVADLFLYVALALAVFSVFMLYNYISTSISNKKRSVGVLRGLGAGSKDVLRIFLSESLIIALVNSVLASVFSAIGCMLVNSYIMNTMHIFVQFALFGVRQILIISGISFVLAFLSSALPIIKIAKKKPVELISRS
jgi:ABC-type antimicrobial peptide transport system permease subunit